MKATVPVKWRVMMMKATRQSTNRTSVTKWAMFFIFLMFFSSALALAPCLLLSYLILKYTPKSEWSFGLVLINQLVAVIPFIALVPAISPRTCTIVDGFIMVAYGPARFLGQRAAYHIWAFAISNAHCFILSCLLPFLHRLRIIQGNSTSSRQILLFALVSRIPYAVEYVATANGHSEDHLRLLMQSEYDFPLDDATLLGYTGVMTMKSWSSTYFMVITQLGPATVILGALLIRWKVNKLLSDPSFVASEQTKRLHRRLMKVFLIQSMVPMLTAFSVITMLLGYYNISRHWLLQYLCFGIAPLIVFVHPIITIHFVVFYRNPLLVLLGLHRRHSSVSSNFDARNHNNLISLAV